MVLGGVPMTRLEYLFGKFAIENGQTEAEIENTDDNGFPRRFLLSHLTGRVHCSEAKNFSTILKTVSRRPLGQNFLT